MNYLDGVNVNRLERRLVGVERTSRIAWIMGFLANLAIVAGAITVSISKNQTPTNDNQGEVIQLKEEIGVLMNRYTQLEEEINDLYMFQIERNQKQERE